jgi:uncharacterized protein YegP (UPF0339 family)
MYFELKRCLTLRGTRWRWRLRAANHRIIATSGEDYHNKGDAIDAIERVRSTGPLTPVLRR